MKVLKKLYIEDSSNKPKNFAKTKEKNFHKSIAFVLILGQLFGMMPIQGVTGPSYRSLYFTWASFRVLYNILLIIGIIFALYASIYDVILSEANIDKISTNFEKTECTHCY